MTFDIVHSIEINAPAARIYDALTSQQGLSGWWTPAVIAEPKVGAICEFTFGTLTTLKFRVDALVPNRSISWSCVQVPEDWENTIVSFEIVDDEDGVVLRFMHSGFQSTERSFGRTSYSWAQYLRSIKVLLEAGQGEPFGSTPSMAAGTTPL